MKKIILLLTFCALLITYLYSFLITINKPAAIRPEFFDEQRMTYLINTHREKTGLKNLISDSVSCEFAQERLSKVKIHFSHDGFKDLAQVFYASSSAIKFGENLSADFLPGDEEQIITSWLSSPTHKANIEEPAFDNMCIKCQDNSCVQIFVAY